jgi:hypothetical protein
MDNLQLTTRQLAMPKVLLNSTVDSIDNGQWTIDNEQLAMPKVLLNRTVNGLRVQNVDMVVAPEVPPHPNPLPSGARGSGQELRRVQYSKGAGCRLYQAGTLNEIP